MEDHAERKLTSEEVKLGYRLYRLSAETGIPIHELQAEIANLRPELQKLDSIILLDWNRVNAHADPTVQRVAIFMARSAFGLTTPSEVLAVAGEVFPHLVSIDTLASSPNAMLQAGAALYQADVVG